MSANITARHPACDGAGCAGCQWTGAASHNPAALTECPVCRRDWRACMCVDDAPDALDVAAGDAKGAERRIDDLPAWTVTAPFEPGAYATARVAVKRETTR